MELSGNTILVTGGGTGIGLALAARFLNDGNKVIIAGRRQSALDEAKAKHPELEIIQGDVGTPAAREALWATATSRFPSLNVLVNNAGIQKQLDLQKGLAPGEWDAFSDELDINLSGPIHLSLLAIPHLLKQPHPAIVTVTSGLSFCPLAYTPVYCATKAALHSFTWSLRHQLKGTPIKVIEVIPPAVDTDLQAPGLHKFGMNVDVFTDEVYGKLKEGQEEVAAGMAEHGRAAYRKTTEENFERMNASNLFHKP